MPNLTLILFWAASLCLPLPMLLQHLGRLWQIDQYQYFPVLILTLLILIFARWDRQLAYPHSKVCWTLLIMGWLAAIVGALVNSPWAASGGWILILGSWLATHRARAPLDGTLLHLWFPSWLLMRLPFGLDLRLTNSLQHVTSLISSELFNLLEIPHARNGNVFELPSGPMLVEEACSGVQSLFSLLFCAFMLVAWLRRSWLLLPMYALAAVGSALIMNIARVIVIGVAQEWYATDLAHGLAHEVLGYLCLGLAILILASADCLLRVLFFPVPEATDSSRWNPIDHLWNLGLTTDELASRHTSSRKRAASLARESTLGPRLATILAILAIGFWIPQVIHLQAQPTLPWELGKERFWVPQPGLFTGIDRLIITKHAFQTGGDNPVLGENADVWDGQYQGLNVQIVLSQPYPEFHDLIWCYTGQGWEQSSYVLSQSDQWKYITSRFVKPPRQFGYLVYSGLGKDGRPVGPLEISPINMVKEWLQWRSRNAFANAQGCQMLQLFAQSEEPLSKEQSDALADLYLQLRTTMQTAYAQQLSQ